MNEHRCWLFDLSSIPAGSTILSSELQFYVSAEGQGFNMYRMLVSWDEATVTFHSIGDRHFAADDNDAESVVDANWPGKRWIYRAYYRFCSPLDVSRSG